MQDALIQDTICHGDCVELMNRQPAETADLLFADPPFNIGYEYDVYEDSLQSQKYIEWSGDWMRAAYRLLKPNGTFWLAIGDEYAAELKIEAQRIGFHCRSWVIWYYTFGVNCARKFTRSHAHLFYFVKDPSDFVFRADDPQNRIPSARQLVYNDRRANPRGRLPDDTWIIRPENAAGELTADEEERVLPEDPNRTWTLRPQDLEGCFRADEDTWYFPRVAGTFRERAGFHGCQMPEQLLGRIIRTCSEPGALVVDPFSGSATTLAVAKKLGRRFLGFELSADYVRLGMERLDAIDVGDPLVGSPEPTASAPKTFSRGRSRRSPKKSESPEANGAGEGNGSSGVALTEPEFARATEAVVEAFRRTHKGYSADRVVVDPELNERYADACRSLGVPGTVRQWNMLLFRQRKAGRLIDVPTTRTTSLSWKECDRFLFASEIAWEMVLQTEGVTGLDEILCDPRLATRFDSVAQQFAPGHTLFEYRWAALKLRKQARVAVQRSRHLQSDPSIASTPAVAAGEWARVPEAPGVYVITAGSEVPVYCGETRDLRSRIRLIASQLSNWSDAAAEYGVRSGELAVQTGEVNVAARQSLVHQCSLIRKLGSTLNVRQLWGT